jgi:16S rRNA (cytidine1402-2'-O)-methyltransferase
MDMAEIFGSERTMLAAREMTKQFEQFVSGSASEVLAYFNAHSDKVRGEFVLVVAGAVNVDDTTQTDWDDLIGVMLKQGLPVKQVAEMVADYFAVKKNAVYPRVQQLKDQQA